MLLGCDRERRAFCEGTFCQRTSRAPGYLVVTLQRRVDGIVPSELVVGIAVILALHLGLYPTCGASGGRCARRKYLGEGVDVEDEVRTGECRYGRRMGRLFDGLRGKSEDSRT